MIELKVEGLSKLDPEFKAKWLEELRSGKYEQGEGMLTQVEDINHHATETFCCLGVAGLACGVEAGKMELLECFDIATEDEILDKIPKQIQGAAWEKAEDYNIVVDILSSFNDGRKDDKYNPEGNKYNFLEIADWIEKEL